MASEKCLIIRNVASMPSNITINKGEKALIVFEMDNNYVMVEYKGGCYPIPKDSIEIIKERV